MVARVVSNSRTRHATSLSSSALGAAATALRRQAMMLRRRGPRLHIAISIEHVFAPGQPPYSRALTQATAARTDSRAHQGAPATRRGVAQT